MGRGNKRCEKVKCNRAKRGAIIEEQFDQKEEYHLLLCHLNGTPDIIHMCASDLEVDVSLIACVTYLTSVREYQIMWQADYDFMFGETMSEPETK